MECRFSKRINRDEGVVRLDSQVMIKNKSSHYIGSIIHKYEEIEEDVKQGGWSGKVHKKYFVIVECLSNI